MKGWGSEVISQRPGGWCAGGAQGTPFLQDTALPGAEQDPPQCAPCLSFSLPSLSTAKHPGLVGNGSVCVPGHTGCQTFLRARQSMELKIRFRNNN